MQYVFKGNHKCKKCNTEFSYEWLYFINETIRLPKPINCIDCKKIENNIFALTIECPNPKCKLREAILREINSIK